MFRLKKSTKYIIIALIVAVSGYMAYNLSGIGGIFNQNVVRTKVDDKRAVEVFNKAGNNQKIKLLFSSADLKSFYNGLQKIYSSNDINPLYANDTSSYYVSVFQFPDSLADGVMAELRQLPKLDQEFLDTPDPGKYAINIQDHIKNKERVKRTLENKIDNAIMLTEDRIDKYNNNLTRIQLEIDSLRNQQKIIKSLEDNKLVYLSAAYQNTNLQTSIKNRRLNTTKNFLIYFLISLILAILVLIVINYFFIFILYLMRLLGIKTARSTSRGSYGYGSYSYKSRYYRRPKKVKKIYKDADGNIVKQKVSKE